jgi:hypothetical protein
MTSSSFTNSSNGGKSSKEWIEDIEVTKAEREWLEDADLWPWKEE